MRKLFIVIFLGTWPIVPVKSRDMFAHGDVHCLHDMQLLQKLRTARRSVQHLPVMVELTQ
jgi:hypothetical protein